MNMCECELCLNIILNPVTVFGSSFSHFCFCGMYWSDVLWPFRCFVVSLVFIVKIFVHLQTIENTFLTSVRFYLQTNFVTDIGNKAFK